MHSHECKENMANAPTEEMLADDPLAPDSIAERNILDQEEFNSSPLVVVMDQLSKTITIKKEVQVEAIMVDEETNKCYTCCKDFHPGCPLPALVVHVQQYLSSKLTVQVCLACYRRLDYDYYGEAVHEEFSGSQILSESKIIVNSPKTSINCFHCFVLLPHRSGHPVSLQEGILHASRPAVSQDSGYEFAVFLCDPCAHWKKQSGLMPHLTNLKFPAYDQAGRTLYLPPMQNVQLQSSSSQTGAKSINYPVSMLVNKARSLLERFKDEASLSFPPSNITGCMMYIHTTKSKYSTSTHWSCDGFAFQKANTRVVRIQNSDHVIRETNWVTVGPCDPDTKFRRRTITSSQMKDITLVHYLGDVENCVKVSREVDLDNEDTNIPDSVKLQNYGKQGLQFFTNSISCNTYKLLISKSHPQMQLYKLMPLASKEMFWNGESWTCCVGGIVQTVKSEVMRLVVDCKLSPEAVAGAFDGITPQYIKQNKSIFFKNFVPRFNCWHSFSGPWLDQKERVNKLGKETFNVVQYLRVPLDTDCKTLLNCYIKDPERFSKVLKNEVTKFPQDEHIQLIQALVHDKIGMYMYNKKLKDRILIKVEEDDVNPDDPDPVDPGPEISDVRSTSFTDNVISVDTTLPTISSVTGSVGSLAVMGYTPTSLAPRKDHYPNNIITRLGPAATKSVFLPRKIKNATKSVFLPHKIKKIHNPVKPQALAGHSTMPLPYGPVLPTQPLPVSKTVAPPTTSLQTLANNIVVSGNKIILPPNFRSSGAQLVQVPKSDGSKRLVLINKSRGLQTTSKNTVTQTTNVVNSIPSTTKSIFVRQQTNSMPSHTLSDIKSLMPTINIIKDEPEPSVDPLEINQPSTSQAPSALPHQSSVVAQTKMNHLSRSPAVQANVCAEIAEECVFNKNFIDVLIYGTHSSELKNPLKTHSLLLSAVSPNLKQLLQNAERNGEGFYELVTPGVTLTEIEALLEEVVGTLLMPPKDDNSTTFTMSEALWSLFAGVRPEDSSKLGKSWIQNFSVVANSFSCKIKSMESLTDHWANQSVCDEQTGQMVIQLGTKRKVEKSSNAQGPSKAIRLSDWSKLERSAGQTNIQEKDHPCIDKNKVDSEDEYEVVIDSVEDNCIQSLLPTHENNSGINNEYNIHLDKLPIKEVSVNVRNIHCKTRIVHLESCKKQKNESMLLPPWGSTERNDCDPLTYADEPLDNDCDVPREYMKTSSNIKGTMVKKKRKEK